MNSVQQLIASPKTPTIQQPSRCSKIGSMHLIKLERGLVQHSLLYCFEKGYFSLIRYLLESGSADARERDSEGRNGLMYCCFIDNDCWAQNIAMTLLEYGGKIEDQDNRGLTALHYAIITQRLVLVRRYLASLDFDLNRAVDIHGNTCLHYACSTGNTDIVRSILDTMKRYLIDLTIKNNHGSTAYDVACQLKHERCQNLLRNEITLFERNNQILKPIHLTHKVLTLKQLMERRSSTPNRIHPMMPTTTVTTKESAVSVPLLMPHAKQSLDHVPIIVKSNHRNKFKSPSVFVEPTTFHRIKLRRNESLDLSLVQQAKMRGDYTTSPLISPSAVYSMSSTTWRDDFAKVFHQLQSFKTPSYRKTIHAPLSSEWPSELFEHLSDANDADGHDIGHHQSGSSRTVSSQKVTHRRRNSQSSASIIHKVKK